MRPMKTNTSPELIAELRPNREKRKPPECLGDAAERCWVRDGARGWSCSGAGACLGCGKRPLFLPGDLALGRKSELADRRTSP